MKRMCATNADKLIGPSHPSTRKHWHNIQVPNTNDTTFSLQTQLLREFVRKGLGEGSGPIEVPVSPTFWCLSCVHSQTVSGCPVQLHMPVQDSEKHFTKSCSAAPRFADLELIQQWTNAKGPRWPRLTESCATKWIEVGSALTKLTNWPSSFFKRARIHSIHLPMSLSSAKSMPPDVGVTWRGFNLIPEDPEISWIFITLRTVAFAHLLHQGQPKDVERRICAVFFVLLGRDRIVESALSCQVRFGGVSSDHAIEDQVCNQNQTRVSI